MLDRELFYMNENVAKLRKYYSDMSEATFLVSTEHQKRCIFREASNDYIKKEQELWDLERKLEMYADALIPKEKHFNICPSSSDS